MSLRSHTDHTQLFVHNERTGGAARERVLGGAREWGGYANRWLGEGAGVKSAMGEAHGASLC